MGKFWAQIAENLEFVGMCILIVAALGLLAKFAERFLPEKRKVSPARRRHCHRTARTGLPPAVPGSRILQTGLFRTAGSAVRLLLRTQRHRGLRGCEDPPQAAG